MEQIEDRAKKNGRTVQEETVDLVGEKHPSKAFIEPQAIGEMVVFLCSLAANEIRGQSFSMDGGWTAK